ncbi:MAG: hypothetical protein OQJ97_15015 [Rhodospirillales bacterium]|nr:hypothetical protein [Rhodospirillales bacterium]
MTHGAQDNAMTEIALALAMAFFSILVLALVSMGGSQAAAPKTALTIEQGAVLSKSQPKEKAQESSKASLKAEPNQLLIFYGGRYFNAALKETNPASYAGRKNIILAVDPSISMTDALEAEKLVPGDRKIVTTLDKKWIAALKEKVK